MAHGKLVQVDQHLTKITVFCSRHKSLVPFCAYHLQASSRFLTESALGLIGTVSMWKTCRERIAGEYRGNNGLAHSA